MSIESEWARLLLRLSDVKWSFSSEFAMQHFVKHRRPEKERAPRGFLSSKATAKLQRVEGFPVYQVHRRDQSPTKHVLFLHGGAYVSPMKGIHWSFIDRLMAAEPCKVTVPLYGLAPNYDYRDAYRLLHAVYKNLLKTHAVEDIVVIGDSSGGGLGLGFAQTLRDNRLPQPGALVLMSPWLDIRLKNPAVADVEPRDPILAAPGNREAGRMWAAGADPAQPMLSPINGSLEGLAPICVMIGSNDILMPDARLLRDKARAEGHPLQYFEYDSMFHIWMLSPIPEGRQALRDIVGFIKDLPVRQEAPPNNTRQYA